jgi:hypothetical protein
MVIRFQRKGRDIKIDKQLLSELELKQGICVGVKTPLPIFKI